MKLTKENVTEDVPKNRLLQNCCQIFDKWIINTRACNFTKDERGSRFFWKILNKVPMKFIMKIKFKQNHLLPMCSIKSGSEQFRKIHRKAPTLQALQSGGNKGRCLPLILPPPKKICQCVLFLQWALYMGTFPIVRSSN